MATHSSILAWRIPRIEEPGRLQSMESQRVRHDWVTFSSSVTLIPITCWEKGHLNVTPINLRAPHLIKTIYIFYKARVANSNEWLIWWNISAVLLKLKWDWLWEIIPSLIQQVFIETLFCAWYCIKCCGFLFEKGGLPWRSRSTGSIPGGGSKIPYATEPKKKGGGEGNSPPSGAIQFSGR